MKTVDRVWFLSHCEWIYNNRQRLKEKPCANFVLTGFVINSFGCPYYGYAIDKITLGNLIKLWDNGFVYKDFPLIHYRISHGDSSPTLPISIVVKFSAIDLAIKMIKDTFRLKK